MNGKWPVFVMGTLVGVIACLSVALAMSHGQATAVAAPAAPAAQDAGGRLLIERGGTAANLDDMLWVLYMRPTAAEDEGGTASKLPKERITLALYKPPQGRLKDPPIQLQSVREISWDLQLMQ
ncbi:MAG: hypothetical protein A3F84_02260 [Candidatus Handelsmanbacteria bacterium RIFCSPLOWO2_12_FULL_64_10]|uniref:Uncharacterized protein n=1 Tax=Handelsmanbacteria sp. (strain RIFCSPLOWO2_12_FULL_64_10) TaxID=1817868 RepID=A0A1F6CLV2_HANXR|nr:MAG: hypothetical protein A3F84_02260 [Candidatus Handelsmanbacteria bacterium RIFCSPLOWO2_12_FULL_64_10]